MFEELTGIKWDVIGLSEVRTDEAYTLPKNRNVVWYRGLMDRRELGVGVLINKDIAGNIEEFYRINETAAGPVTKLIKRCKLEVVQAYTPTSSHDDQLVESFYEDANTAIVK